MASVEPNLAALPVPSALPQFQPVMTPPPIMPPGGWTATVLLHPFSPPLSTDPTPDNHIESRFAPDGEGTLLTLVMRMDSPEAMEAMIATGMTDGMEVTYARIDELESEVA